MLGPSHEDFIEETDQDELYLWNRGCLMVKLVVALHYKHRNVQTLEKFDEINEQAAKQRLEQEQKGPK